MARAPVRRKPRSSSSRPTRPKGVGLSIPRPKARIDLAEDPHAHVVCRSCGRIQRIELSELDRHVLTELASRTPDGWSVDGIAFSLTGGCLRCREGSALYR